MISIYCSHFFSLLKCLMVLYVYLQYLFKCCFYFSWPSKLYYLLSVCKSFSDETAGYTLEQLSTFFTVVWTKCYFPFWFKFNYLIALYSATTTKFPFSKFKVDKQSYVLRKYRFSELQPHPGQLNTYSVSTHSGDNLKKSKRTTVFLKRHVVQVMKSTDWLMHYF